MTLSLKRKEKEDCGYATVAIVKLWKITTFVIQFSHSLTYRKLGHRVSGSKRAHWQG